MFFSRTGKKSSLERPEALAPTRAWRRVSLDLRRITEREYRRNEGRQLQERKETKVQHQSREKATNPTRQVVVDVWREMTIGVPGRLVCCLAALWRGVGAGGHRSTPYRVSWLEGSPSSGLQVVVGPTLRATSTYGAWSITVGGYPRSYGVQRLETLLCVPASARRYGGICPWQRCFGSQGE